MFNNMGSIGDSRGVSETSSDFLGVSRGGLDTFLGGDLCVGSSARIPGFSGLFTFNPGTRICSSSPYLCESKVSGENASTLLAMLPTGLTPLLFVILLELLEDVMDEPDSDGVCALS